MKIKSIDITNLFGYMNKRIEFFDDISLLVGINGAGKTSILNLVNWILNPSIEYLCITEFKQVVLVFEHQEEEYSIECIHQDNMFTYTVYSNKKKFTPLTAKIRHSKQNADIEKNLNLYRNLSPEEKEQETFDFIQKLPKPAIIGLDRTLYMHSQGDVYIDSPVDVKYPTRNVNKNISPIQKAKELINREYRASNNKVFIRTRDLKNKIMLSAFEAGVESDYFLNKNKHNIHENHINIVRTRVKEYFHKYEKDNFKENELIVIDKYFDNLQNIARKKSEDGDDEITEIFYKLNANQFNKIVKLLQEFEDFEKKSKEYFYKIDLFLEIVNSFLKDSNKKLVFNNNRGISEICYHTTDFEGNILTKNNDIRNLSSGEEQITVLFAYLIFENTQGNIFIIDEPELSLHIRWQENFMSQIEKILSNKKQLILATHSPILVGKKKERAIVITPS